MYRSPVCERYTDPHTQRQTERGREGEKGQQSVAQKAFVAAVVGSFLFAVAQSGSLAQFLNNSPFLHRQQIFLLIQDKCHRRSSGREANVGGL